MLEGKKTYLAALAVILAAVAAALAGTCTWGEALNLIVPAVMGATVRSGVTSEAKKTVINVAKTTVPVLFCLALLMGCSTATPTATQPASANPNASSGQGESRATAAMFQSKATAGDTGDAPLNSTIGTQAQTITVPFSLWNPTLNAGKGGWEIPLDKDGKPYVVTSNAGVFNYSTGTFANSATISGTASGAQTQAGTATTSGTQTATPTSTTTPTLTVTPNAATKP